MPKLLKRLVDWLTLADYTKARDVTGDDVHMSRVELNKLSLDADGAMIRLQYKFGAGPKKKRWAR